MEIEPPAALSKAGASLFSMRVASLRALGRFAAEDLPALARYCEAWDRWRALNEAVRELEAGSSQRPEAKLRIGARKARLNQIVEKIKSGDGITRLELKEVETIEHADLLLIAQLTQAQVAVERVLLSLEKQFGWTPASRPKTTDEEPVHDELLADYRIVR